MNNWSCEKITKQINFFANTKNYVQKKYKVRHFISEWKKYLQQIFFWEKKIFMLSKFLFHKK